MNTEARDNIHKCKEALGTAHQALSEAANTAENATIKNQILTQANSISNCLDECERISSGLSQYLHEKKYEGIHHQ